MYLIFFIKISIKEKRLKNLTKNIMRSKLEFGNSQWLEKVRCNIFSTASLGKIGSQVKFAPMKLFIGSQVKFWPIM